METISFSLTKDQTNVLKGIAILFVLLGHLGYLYLGGAYGVDLFLMVSGYGVFSSYLDYGVKDFYRKKIGRIYLPYLIVMLFEFLVKREYSFTKIAFTALGLDCGYNIDATMWYISYIFLWYSIFFVCVWLSKRMKWNAAVVVLLFLFGILQCGLSYKLHIVWNQNAGAFLYAFAFPTGVLLRYIGQFSLRKSFFYRIEIIISFLSFVLFFEFYCNVNNGIEYMLFAMVVSALPIFIVYATASNNSWVYHQLVSLGKYSYAVYLIEAYLLGERTRMLNVIQNDFFRNMVYIILTIGAAVFLQKTIFSKLEYAAFQQGIPFDVRLPENTVTRVEAMRAFEDLRSQATDVPEMSSEEINAEISAVRADRKKR